MPFAIPMESRKTARSSQRLLFSLHEIQENSQQKISTKLYISLWILKQGLFLTMTHCLFLYRHMTDYLLRKRRGTRSRCICYNTVSSDPDYLADKDSEPETFTQSELNNSVHDLNLSKTKRNFLLPGLSRSICLPRMAL